MTYINTCNFQMQPNCPVHEERRISAEQPQPTADHHTITTAHRPDYTPSSVLRLVRNQSTRSMAAPAAGHGDDAQKLDSHSCHFPTVFSLHSQQLCSKLYVLKKKVVIRHIGFSDIFLFVCKAFVSFFLEFRRPNLKTGLSG